MFIVNYKKGLDSAGVITKLGDKVTNFKVSFFFHY
jgi:NADPH:quinone reductase-like Zn-dependent oxidoreductase